MKQRRISLRSARRDPASFAHEKEIQKVSGVVDVIIDWCKSEMIAEWRWHLVETSSKDRPGRYTFYFDNDRDYCAFILKWA